MSHDDLAALLRNVTQSVADVEGWLSRRETEFLALVAACPTTDGDILEIGSFRGRSTIALALALQHRARSQPAEPTSQLIAVDPMLDDDPLLDTPLATGTARATFEGNLRNAGVRDDVEFHQAYSYEMTRDWRRPLRLLWIDGDHQYASTKQDFDLFVPHLANGAILAMHDVLSRYDGCIRVFTEDVLTSPHIGAAGLCGSIGWAQYFHTPQAPRRSTGRLLNQLQQLVPYHCQDVAPRGLAKLRYQWLRSRVPHQSIDPRRWQQLVHAA